MAAAAAVAADVGMIQPKKGEKKVLFFSFEGENDMTKLTQRQGEVQREACVWWDKDREASKRTG